MAYIHQQRLKQTICSQELFQMVSHVAKDLMGFIVKAFEDKLGLHATINAVYDYIRQFINSILYMRSLKQKKMFYDFTYNLEVYKENLPRQVENPLVPVTEWDGDGILIFSLEH
jgi:hypothetical protein